MDSAKLFYSRRISILTAKCECKKKIKERKEFISSSSDAQCFYECIHEKFYSR